MLDVALQLNIPSHANRLSQARSRLDDAFGASWARADKVSRTFISPTDLRHGDHLGSGSFGSINSAQWFKADGSCPLVAVKTLHAHLLNESSLKTFKRSLELELSLERHPNVVSLFGWALDLQALRLMLVMEVCSGGSLAASIELGVTEQWSNSQRLGVALQIASGVAFLHAQSVMHRDLKPGNILAMDSSPPVYKIADFGVSRIQLSEDNSDSSNSTAVGDLVFSAPEQLNHKACGMPADVWAFGCLLVCLVLDCKHPYTETRANDMQVLLGICNGSLIPSLPPDSYLYELVHYCCSFDPGRRPNAYELPERLREKDT